MKKLAKIRALEDDINSLKQAQKTQGDLIEFVLNYDKEAIVSYNTTQGSIIQYVYRGKLCKVPLPTTNYVLDGHRCEVVTEGHILPTISVLTLKRTGQKIPGTDLVCACAASEEVQTYLLNKDAGQIIELDDEPRTVEPEELATYKLPNSRELPWCSGQAIAMAEAMHGEEA